MPVQTVVSIIGVVVGVIGFIWGVAMAIKKVSDDADTKRGRIYSRLDEVKASNDETFVRKDICDVKYTMIVTTLNEMSSDIKKLLTRNGIKE